MIGTMGERKAGWRRRAADLRHELPEQRLADETRPHEADGQGQARQAFCHHDSRPLVWGSVPASG